MAHNNNSWYTARIFVNKDKLNDTDHVMVFAGTRKEKTHRCIADCGSWENKEAQDNARLIAKTPDLLSACLALIKRIEVIEQADGIDALTASVVHEAKIVTLDAQGLEEEGYNC